MTLRRRNFQPSFDAILDWRYKYPQGEFPYARLVAENAARGKHDPEFELEDTGIFTEDRYFDVAVLYAKAGPEDLLIRIMATNRGPDPAELHLLPHLWYRNTWSWGRADRSPPRLRFAAPDRILAEHPAYGTYELLVDGDVDWLFCENETNAARLFGARNAVAHVKDGIGDRVVYGATAAVNPEGVGSKCAAWQRVVIPPGETAELRLRLRKEGSAPPFADFEEVFGLRKREADEFYDSILGGSAEGRAVGRQALSGMLWTKQFYHYVVDHWLEGDPASPPPPERRRDGRNRHWAHMWNEDIISMPDKWEYPWYAAWDLAFHCVTLALADPDFAKEQLLLLLREWYLHPNGQLPAYEWAFSDVNPPVHAWAALRVYEIEERRTGRGDRGFLERVFHKLLLNFTWWVNRKDAEGNNIFEGGFLGLDNIGVFDRSAGLPGNFRLEQSDGSSWMAMYCLHMLRIARELARDNPAYEDVASKFFEHFVHIAEAVNDVGADGTTLWNDEDGFYYDLLHVPGGAKGHVQVRSMVGLIPLFASLALDEADIRGMPAFAARLQWFLDNRPALVDNAGTSGPGGERLLSLVNPDRLRRILSVMLDESEFLSPFGIRSLSRVHAERPYILRVGGQEYRVAYDPGESTTGMFGGNSNWRGPIWFPVNFLLIEALREFGAFLGDGFKVPFPAAGGPDLALPAIADELARRLCALFLPGPDGARPAHGTSRLFRRDPHWRNHVLFYEYFHGDTGAGLGASHQTGWTGLVANLFSALDDAAVASPPYAESRL
ncbi:MAG: glucosidase [Candidatus Sericytochromatia bacterium]|nr:glucosidase [Candidatus Tanganyikabacteria bacterium]